MPIFEFQCRECGEKVEKILRAPVEEIACPHCGKTAKKLVSTVSAAASGGDQGCAAPSGSGFG